MWRYFNPNPLAARVGDCAVRALCKATGRKWEDVFIKLCDIALKMGDMPSSNNVWGAFLRLEGFERRIVPNSCPDCYSLKKFCEDFPEGTFVVALPNHVVCVKNGDFFDSWDSGDEVPIFYWKEAEKW